ncbi:hypothetical protein FOMPIDRAFT_1090759, partial [Fomitopsis schrenkii]
LLSSQTASAKPINRTIDDHYGDSFTGVQPAYGGRWNYGPNCSECAIHPEPADTFMSSWHDSTTSPTNDISVALNFTGTAIWVYCIIPDTISTVQGVSTFVNISFELDDKPVEKYTHPPGATSYEYNVTVYSHPKLDNTQHILKMSAVQGENSSVFLFDWAKYT